MTKSARFHVLPVLLAFCTIVAAEPIREKPRPPISATNAMSIEKAQELLYDARDIVWGPKERQVALVGWEKRVEVLDAGTFDLVDRIGADKRLIHLAVKPGGDTIATCENGTHVELRDIRLGKVLSLETGSHQPAMAFSPDGKLLATGGYSRHAKLWDVNSGQLIRSLDCEVVGGLTPVFSPDGKTLAIGNRNSTTRLFDVDTGKLLHVLDKRMTQELRFRPDGRVLAIAYVDGSVSLWDVTGSKLLHDAHSGAKEVYTLDWSPKGDVLATAGLEGKIILWDPRGLSILKKLQAPEWVIRVRFSPDGTRLLSAGGTTLPSDRKVVVWSVPAGGDK